jgi:hypothetical protein
MFGKIDWKLDTVSAGKDHMACIDVITKMMGTRLEEKNHLTKDIDQFTKIIFTKQILFNDISKKYYVSQNYFVAMQPKTKKIFQLAGESHASGGEYIGAIKKRHRQ